MRRERKAQRTPLLEGEEPGGQGIVHFGGEEVEFETCLPDVGGVRAGIPHETHIVPSPGERSGHLDPARGLTQIEGLGGEEETSLRCSSAHGFPIGEGTMCPIC